MDWAVGLAAATGSPLHLVHAESGGSGAPPPRSVDEFLATARSAGVIGTTVEVVTGSPVAALRSRADAARMLVLGSCDDGAPPGVRVGGIALALVGRVDCPIAIVRGLARGPAPSRTGSVVVGTDGSSADRRVVDTAAELAEAVRTDLLIVHAWTDVAITPRGLRRCTGGFETQQQAARSRLDDERRRIAAGRPSLPVAGEVVSATALQALLDRSSDASIVVVGHGNGATGMASGSTMRSLVEFAPCTVVWVPSGVEVLAGRASGSAAPRRGPTDVRDAAGALPQQG
ncbi:universal stress protein family [Pseudonocardia sp. N23]|nr:universal stress protein family [Pseudonocardia sp. N23]